MTCACSSGRFASDGACSICTKGMVCLGGNAPPSSCPTGLATVMTGARSFEQCLTTAGFGRLVNKTAAGQLLVQAQPCQAGSYNAGGNSSPCQRCGSGLTTAGEGAKSARDCVAPAGSYMGGGSGLRCPRGTYTPAFNDAPACTPCRNGLTTANEGSSASSACRLAKAGFYVMEVQLPNNIAGEQLPAEVPGVPEPNGVQAAAAAAVAAAAAAAAGDANGTYTEYVAVPCPVGTYQDKESEASSCTSCPNGLTTREPGADGVVLCLAPPGVQLLPGAENVSDCPVGSYKEGWNLNPCISCGEGLLTESTGAVALDACFVPAGWGIEIDTITKVRSAVMCVLNTYGQSSASYDLLTTRCIPCPEGTATADIQSGVTAAAGYTSSQACMPLPGWGYTAAGAVEKCMVGSWSAGGQQRVCRACAAMYTTAAEGAVSSNECWVEAGWAVQGSRGLPQPCSQGSFSVGGSAGAPGGSCTTCPEGFTTQEPAAESADDCNICSPGYGGAQCQPCSYGTYSFGGSTDACRNCGAGQTSARGADSSSQCVVVWPQDRDSYTMHVHISDESAWADSAAGDATEQACRAQCGAGCIMYRYNAGDKKCQVLLELTAGSPGFSSRAAVGLKAFSGGAVLDYAFYYVPASLDLGVQIKDVRKVTMADCLKACSRSEACVLVRVAGNASSSSSSSSLDSCVLLSGQLDADWVTSYQVTPQRLLSDGFVVDTL
uniref:Tyrosine-protein kinase ephrin type A/B receptor-like domain-containing protein n=1 Tax=Tetradesmus obliquus TaxID=3088 RepID=A0A383VZF6_TETOB|eukprot:jgi/Sobl393_1/12664/SZX70174.1